MPAITDISAYSTLDTEFQPRILARNSAGAILLDGYIAVAAMPGGEGVFFISFRPNQSPQTWMYVAGSADYRKISAPDSAGAALDYPVGLQEPQAPPEVASNQPNIAYFSDNDGKTWTPGGTASGMVQGTRVSDTIADVMLDPASISRWSLEVSAGKYYQIGQKVVIGDASDFAGLVIDVIPETNPATTISIDAIYYFSGSTGRCVIVPQQTPNNPSVPNVQFGAPLSGTIFAQSTLASLRRGALVQLNGSETVFVLSATKGPLGQLCFECETTGTFVPGDTMAILPTIIVDEPSISAGEIGQAIKSYSQDSTVTGAGTGTFSSPLANNPFSTTQGQQAQLDDYVSFSVNMGDLATLVLGRIVFNVGPTVDYSTDVFYAEFTAADVARAMRNITVAAQINNAPSFDQFLKDAVSGLGPFGAFQLSSPAFIAAQQAKYDALYGNQSQPTTGDGTVYPADQWSVIQLPVRALTRAGNDQSRTLANCNGVQLQVQTAGTSTVKFSSFWVGGGGQPDVGLVGSPYFYRAIGRGQATGVMSNPSPQTAYGVFPRRQSVRLQITDSVGDTQQTKWDIYRYGGTVTSWRYIGSAASTPLGTATFTDNVFDTTALAGQELEFDNFQPWPSVALPVPSITGVVTVTGTALDIVFTSSDDVPPEITRWLPGTLILVNDAAYTLWTRPIQVSGLRYLLRVAESMGAGDDYSTVSVQEPFIARQTLPYAWGPDATGTVFGCGDSFRPGTLYYAKPNNPDSAPDTFNQEITSPSEPLIGGEVLNGLSYSSSSARWFALYPAFDSPTQRYQRVERPIGRALAAPYGHCNDGRNIYFWATDGIWITDGTSGQSLTEGPMRNLFPHEGVAGQDVTYAGFTIHAPDYRYIAQFRLGYAKGYLYADYRDSDGLPRTLVLDLGRKAPAWVVDEYADPITVHLLIRGPEDNIASSPSLNYPKLIMGDTNGSLWVQEDFVNDGGAAIPCAVGTFEYNGGDVRADQFWGDSFLDSIPASGLTATPMVNSTAAASPTSIPASTTRVQAVVNSSNLNAKYLGLLLEWSEDFDYLGGSHVTRLLGWQPMCQAVPISIYTWKTQGTSFGLDGYLHVREVLAAYQSTAEVTLTITVYDGNAPDPIILPSTNGEYRKFVIPFSFNKGLLYAISGVSTEPWTPYFDTWEFHVGQWGRTGQYLTMRDIEAPKGLARSIES